MGTADNQNVGRFRLRGLRLQRGDLVEVLPAAQILATLDDTGSLEGVPFMPEMLAHLGRHFTVEARLERACDTIHGSGLRRMPNTVVLDDLRCGGSGHGGCQAGCRLFWKEAWLRRVSPRTRPQQDSDEKSRAELERLARQNARVKRAESSNGTWVYRCQATEFVRATEPVSWRDVGSLLGELTCGNVGPRRLVRVGLRAFATELKRKLDRLPALPFEPVGRPAAPPEPVSLKAGDLVQVRPLAEIEQTLDAAGKNRGLQFDAEMVPFCGQTRTVSRQVKRFVDERTGELVELNSDCFVLDGVVCSGDLSDRRWLCPRAIYPWWRAAWLHPVDEE